MDAWFHNENTYPFVPQDVLDRAPTRCARACPTATATPGWPPTCSRRCIDEFLLCDELGLNVVAIEHHAGINSLLGANPMLTSAYSRARRGRRAS